MNGTPEWVPTWTAEQVRRNEAPLLDRGLPLMLWAAAGLASVIADELVEPGVTARKNDLAYQSAGMSPLMGRILVVAGRGDNGGDALYAAAALQQWIAVRGIPGDDLSFDILLTGDSAHAQALATAEAGGAKRVSLEEAVALASEGAYDLILDGILGIGTSADPALRGGARAVVEALLPAVRAGMSRVIAVDLPSGLHPDTGATSDGVVLPASVTVTFGGVKTGLARDRGKKLAGAVVWVDLGLAFDEAPDSAAPIAYAFDGSRGTDSDEGDQPTA
ncbi:NAD(P)H-hydrate epimerase [Microbacterium sp. SS28]|uniref:NAD(P)H-hydrate epimerase n=1 Tax=Microbacterium sp. SS28 TaxID=2919948 RepID=UPI001FAAFE23|nr:NAD(P)H-hydrate epimerase [Microbacterium sp. SS28]